MNSLRSGAIPSIGDIMELRLEKDLPWLQERKASTPHQLHAKQILKSIRYEICMGLVSLFNIWIVVMDVDSASLGKDAPWWAGAFSVCLMMLYIIELAVRFYAFGLHMYTDPYSWLDTSLVLLDLLGLFTGEALKQAVSLRILRLSWIIS